MTSFQFDVLRIVLMHLYIIYLAWFFRKGHSRGMTAAEHLCLVCVSNHTYVLKPASAVWSVRTEVCRSV